MKRLPMRKIREALRLRADGFSGRQVAQSLSLGRATISDYFRRAEIVSLGWPLPNGVVAGIGVGLIAEHFVTSLDFPDAAQIQRCPAAQV